MSTKHKIIIGDSRRMSELDDSSVHLVVTSPPYWQLKDYGYEGQIGFDDTYEDYINNLNLVWSECIRALHPGCRMAVNIGDQFARSVYYGRYKIIPIRTEIIRFCETMGLDYMGAVIWQKKTTMNTTGGASIMGSYPYPRNGILELDYEFILLFKKLGKPPKVSKDVKEQARLTKEEWKEYFSGHWYFGGARQNGHIAMFPEELPARLIKMFTFLGETVLDPFMGSGTTALAAKNLGRNSIGYEADVNLESVIKEKVGTGLEVKWRARTCHDWNEEIKALPYVFRDPVSFDRPAASVKSTFGSKVGYGDKTGEEGLIKVKEVISPKLVLLDNGDRVRLLGVKEKPGKARVAVEFLRLKAEGRRVSVKHDSVAGLHDGEGNVMGYLYLKNRTFLNAHLIKKGFADVDTSSEYGRKKLFMSYAEKSATA